MFKYLRQNQKELKNSFGLQNFLPQPSGEQEKFIEPEGFKNVSSLYRVFEERELALYDRINNNAIIFICIVIFVLMLFLYIIKVRITNIAENITIEDVRMAATYISAVSTVVFLFFYQIAMFGFGTRFKFTGSYGNEEILFIISEKIRNNI